MLTLERLATGLVLGLAISIAAFALKALSPSGAVAAAAVGGITLGAGGFLPGALLLTFFITSSALSRAGARRKSLASAGFEKGSRRDAGQVLANGGLPAALSLAFGLGGGEAALVALAGALAAVTADTWGTEIGLLAGGVTRRLTDGRRVEPGISGGLSREGSLAAIAGSGLIAGLAGAFSSSTLAGAAWVGGVAGAVVDSLLGATVQAMYTCPTCGKETEKHPLHVCGTPSRHLRGWAWLNNDAVNALASATGALVALGVWLAWSAS